MSDEYVYGLRTCLADMTAHGGFTWSREGWVEAPDWKPEPIRGGGLHFLRNGEGDASFLNSNDNAVWLVVKAFKSETVDIDSEKSKAKRCEVVYAGSRDEAVTLLRAIVGTDKRIPFVSEKAGDWSTQTAGDESTQTAGDKSTQTAGDRSTQTAGYKSIQTAGYKSTQTAGYESTQTVGDKSTQTAGDRSNQTGGYRSTQTAGDLSTQTAGYLSTQTAGYRSTQTAGNWSTQTAGSESTQTAGDLSTQTAGDKSTQTAGDRSNQTGGNRSTQTAGDESTQTGEDGSVFIARWLDLDENRYRVATAIVGEDGTLKPNTPYRFQNGIWTEATDQSSTP